MTGFDKRVDAIDADLRAGRLDAAHRAARALLAETTGPAQREAAQLLAFAQSLKGPVTLRLLDGAVRLQDAAWLQDGGGTDAAADRMQRRQIALLELRGWYRRARGNSLAAGDDFGAAHRMARARLDRLGVGAGDPVLLPADAAVRFGNLGVYADVFLKLRALGWIPSWRGVLPVGQAANGEPACNPSLLSLLCRQSGVLTTADDAAAVARLPVLPLTIPVLAEDGRGLSLMEAASRIDRAWAADGRGPVAVLPAEDRARGFEILRAAAGMAPDDWFVALHLREPGRFYRARGWADGEDAHRAQSLAPTLAALRQVTDRGGHVVRMGDPSVVPLPAAPRLFDYAHSTIRSPEMDLFLCAAARFLWGTASGPIAVAWLFGTPTVATNWIPVSYPPPPANSLFVPKLVRQRATGRLLGLAELLQDPARHALHAGIYAEHGLEALETDADDVAGLIAEWLDDWDGGRQPPPATARQQAAAAVFEAAGLVMNSRIGDRFLDRHSRVLLP